MLPTNLILTSAASYSAVNSDRNNPHLYDHRLNPAVLMDCLFILILMYGFCVLILDMVLINSIFQASTTASLLLSNLEDLLSLYTYLYDLTI